MTLNYFHKVLVLLTLALSLCAVAATDSCLAKSEQTQNDISLDFKEVELTDLIKIFSEMTGRNFIYDERVRGKVTIISPDPMNEEEAYQLFMTVLNVKGFTLIQSGKVNKIVPLQNAKQNNLPVSDTLQGDSYITRLIHLNYADAQVISSSVLLPLIPKTSNLTVYAPTNTLILTDSAANIDRLVEIINKLDLPSALDRLEVFTLKQASAEEIASIANSLMNKQTNPSRKRTARTSANQPGQVIAYPRTNTLLAIASDDELKLIRRLIKTLDTPSEQGRSNINVYYLKNAAAETLAKTLNEIMVSSKRAPAANNKLKSATTGPVIITADKPTNSLLISAGPEDFVLLKQVIEKLDIRRNQVYVEALILELSMDATREIGVSLQGAASVGGQGVILGSSNLNNSSTNADNSVNFGSFAPVSDGGIPSLLTQSVKGLMLGGFSKMITTTGPDGSTIRVPAISALIQLSQTSSDVNILSAPRLLTSDNEEAEIIVGSNVPIITSRLTDTGSAGLAQSVTVERKDVALTLRFTPQVTEGDMVRLSVFQEITDVASENDATGPTLTKRQIRNTVMAKSGTTVVLGRLIGTNVQKTEFKVPLLGDIPLLGRLFRSKGTSTRKTNLLVFITPRVIHNASEMAEITRQARFTSQGFQTEELKKSINKNALIFDLDPAASTEETPAKDE